MRDNNPMLTSKLFVCYITGLHADGFSCDFYNRDSFGETIDMRGNNSMPTLKLHVLLNISAPL